jgi:hypothetical protein
MKTWGPIRLVFAGFMRLRGEHNFLDGAIAIGCHQGFVTAAAVFAAILIVACATPAERADSAALTHGYEKVMLNGASFRHVAYFKPGVSGTTLHVYIEHDGTPWATLTSSADDPTPRQPLMLELMAGDPASVLYLGRPCYFGTAASPPCEAIWWTHRRFSKEVIQSMDAALLDFLHSHTGFQGLEFYGYSGGGVIAALMAQDFPATRRLVTVAAPLDLNGWVHLHQYAALEGSIDPLRQPPLPASVMQFHLAGQNDDVVPAYLIKPFVSRQTGARFVEIPGFEHFSRWGAVWITTVLAP